MKLIACENLSIGYDNKTLLSDLNFTINKGDYLCVIGENGAGKSTLIKTILGLKSPIKGSISAGDDFLSTDIGYLPQQSVIQKDFPASVNEIVLSGCLNKHKIYPFYTASDKKIANQNMKKMGIYSLKKRSYRELSGGQQQRVLLARALCAGTKLIIVDEPVSGLDPKASDEMYKVFKDLNSQGVSILMISHDMKALNFSSHILYLGKKVFFGEVNDFKKTDAYTVFLEEKGEENDING